MQRLFFGPPRRCVTAVAVLCLTNTPSLSTAQAPQRPLPILPLTQLDERAASPELDNRTFTIAFAEPQPIRDALMLVARGTGLSIVPDPGVAGSFAGDLKNVTVRQALEMMLPPLGLGYSVDGTFIRVFRRQFDTRIFDLNYPALERTGSTVVRGGSESVAAVSTAVKGDVFADLANGVRALLSDGATFNVDRKAGLLQVTDAPDRLDRVAVYLDAVQERVHRQAFIDARVIEVVLNDEKARGLDWTALSAQPAAAPGAPRPSRATLSGSRVTDVGRFIALLEAQGTVNTLASPRLVAMNNEPAIVRTDTMTLAVTAQIASDAFTLSVSPIVTAPSRAESDLLARVADGETLVVGGFGVDRETRERKAVGTTGGWFGRGTVVTRRRVELLILLTPRIASGR